MRTTDLLMDEHRQIERVLLALALEIGRARQGAPADPAFFEQMVQFIEVFLEGSHHAKEERVLFAALREHGLAPDDGPLRCMLREHDMARKLAAHIAAAARAARQGEPGMLDVMLECAAEWAQVLAMHIQKEEGGVFHLAQERLGPQVQEQMLARCTGVGRPYEEFVAAAAALERLRE